MPTNQQRRETAKRKLERQQQRRVQRSQRRKRATMVTVIVVVLAVVGVLVSLSLLNSGGTPPPPGANQASPSSAPSPPPLQIPTQVAPPPKRPQALPAAVSCAYPPDGSPARPVRPPATSNISARGTERASLATSAGTIDLTLDKALAPCTVNSFVSLVKQGYYDNTPCHRLTTSPGLQVLQCGDPTGSGSGGPGYKFADEVYPELTYGRGYLAMANGGPDTNGSQFFMIYGSASALTPNYTVFGTIEPAGLQVLDTVARAGHDGSLDPSPGGGKPSMHVVIAKATAG
ncbi:MAG: peptidylprolyl isomerase [Pseudonocardia sp.]|nr:peptidylprolyl isomerase [Pseudonocardia sp.]